MAVVKVEALANTTQAQAQINAVTAAVERMNAAMAASVKSGTGTFKGPGTVAQMKAVEAATNDVRKAWTASIASSGELRASQVAFGEVVARNTDLLKNHKLTLSQTFGKNSRGMMKAIYREQLAMAHGFTMVQDAGTAAGRTVANMAIPTQVHKSWDTLNNRVGMFRYRLASASNMLVNWGKNVQWSGRQLSAGLTMPIVAFGAAAGVMAYKVDKELTRVAKVYNTTANSMSNDTSDMIAVQKELDDLRAAGTQTAIKAAQEYGASVTDTLAVQADLAATGQKGIDLQKATAEVQRIATLGELDHQTATKATIALQQVFRMSTEDLTESFNYMNAVENATSLTTRDFAVAIPIAASTVREFGGDVQELGVLMTAMVSRGIQAGKAANGIKAAMQRLSRPSKAVQEQFKEITNVDIVNLVDKSTSLTDIFSKLYQITKDLGNADRRKVFAGLFGTYQVQTMTALVDGMKDINDQYGQTYDAQQLANASTKEWADIADREMKRYQESISGRFKIAWESVKAEIATMGEPFLKVGGMVLRIVTKIFKAFNSLPGVIKNFAAFGLIFAALVGPVVMLIGLFANFAGSLGKAAASSLRLISSFKILNKEEWASKAASSLAEKGFYSQGTAAELLAKQVTAVGQAVNYMAAEMAKAAGSTMPAFLGGPMGPLGPASPTNKEWTQMYMQDLKNPKTGRYRVPTGGASAAERAAQERLAKEHMKASGLFARNATQTEKAMVAQEKTSKAIQSSLSGAAVSMGTMAIASGVLMMTGEGTVHSMAKYALIAALVIPAVKGIAVALKAGAIAAWSAAAAETQKVRMQAASLVFLEREVGIRTILLGLARGTAAAMKSMMGIVGWTVAGIIATGIIANKISSNMDAYQKREIANQKALTQSTEEWSSILDVAVKKHKELSTATWASQAGMSPQDMARSLKASDDGKALVQAYKDADTEQQKGTIAAQQYLQILNTTKATAEQARAALEAMFIAAGDGALEAQAKAEQLWSTFGGDVSQGDMESVWQRQISDISDGLVDDVAIAGQQIGQSFATALADGSKRDMELSMDHMSGALQNQWDTIISGYKDSWKEMLSASGISGDKFRDMFADIYAGMDSSDVMAKYGIDAEKYASTLTALYRDIRNVQGKSGKGGTQLLAAEKQIAQELANQLGIEREINTLAQLRNTWEWKLQNVTKKTAQNLFNQQVAGQQAVLDKVNGVLNTNYEVSDEQKLQVLNQIRLALGLEEVNSLGQGFIDWSKQGADETGKIADNVKNIGAIHIQLSVDQLKDTLKSGYEGVSEDYADAISDNFDAAMQASVDRNTKKWDTRIDAFREAQERRAKAFDRRQDDITDAFDKRWQDRQDRVAKAYDNRIKAVNDEIKAEQKAEEIRQKIFEAEQSRLDRLTESANRGIDFNMALQTGNLDEAAKIRNDMDAAAQQWALSDASEAGGSASQNRIDRLQNQSDHIEKQKDRALKALEEEEKARRKALDRRLQDEKDNFDKIQQARMDALQAEADAQKDAYQHEWDMRKDNLEDQLELFKSFVPKNQKQLQNWIDMMHGDFKKFGTGTLNPLSEEWSGWFEAHLHKHMRKAALEIGSDNMWDQMASKVAKTTIKNMGFGSIAAFENFVKTGQLPANFGKINRDKPGNFWAGPNAQTQGIQDNQILHGGGEVGSRASSRTGVARTAPLHPSEKLIVGREGEFMVNRGAMKQHGEVVRAINDGSFNPRKGILGGLGGGLPGIIMGIYGSMFAGGLANGLIQGFNQRYGQVMAQSMFGGTFGNIKAGKYGDIGFDSEQLTNAATIANVGRGLGMSARDIAIGIMTAITESGLRNLKYGDADSQGLFQQRPSQGWGTIEQVTDPTYAATQFFNHLKGISDRGDMSPWLAAQSVQRSAYSDGSNYRPYWNEATAIFAALKASGVGSYIPGPGGKHKPTDSNDKGAIHDAYTGFPAVDISVPVGHPAFAVGSGIITRSEDLVGNDGRVSNGGYYSYGRVIQLKLDSGPEVLYAHLSQRGVSKGDRVSGGAVIGRTGNTGHSFGPHLHFGATQPPGPLAFLKRGGMTLNDGIAMLHRGETVLTKDLSGDLKDTVSAFGKTSREAMSGRNRVKTDPYVDTGFWTYLSGQVGKAVADSGIGDSGAIRSGTYNSGTGATPKLKADLQRLMPLVDVLSIEEMNKGDQTLAPWFAQQGWGWYNGGHQGTGLLWNKSTVSASGLGSQALSAKGGPAKGHRFATYGKFNKDGAAWWQIAAHTIAWPYDSPARRAEEIRQYLALNSLWKRLNSGGTPVILGGDLNDDIARGNWIKKIGLDIDKRAQGPGTHSSSRHPGAFIDHLMQIGLTPGEAQLIMGLSSDHNALINSFNIPSHKKGAGNIKWDNTLVNLHKKESVLTQPQSDNFRYLADNLDKLALGGGNQYDIKVEVKDTNASPDAIARKVMQAIEKKEARLPQKRTSR